MSELRDCPFCGGPAHLVIGDEFCHIRCHQCGATGALADAIRESDAIATWNRRPAPDVEKVAGALFRAQMISTRSWEETDEDIRESYRVNARAAIAAMEG